MTELTWQKLEQVVRTWIGRPPQRPATCWVAAEPGGKTIPGGQRFEPEASYFGIRLVEMSLAEGGKYFTSFLPLGVCLTEYTVGQERQRRPMILSNDAIASQLRAAGAAPGYVEYTNMYAVRCAPVKADNLSLFVGLFRMPYGDLARQVLQIAADLTEQVGGATAAPVAGGLRIAEKVYDRMSGLFGLKDVTPRFGFADGNALTKSGYLLVAGPEANAIDENRLRVIDNRLHLDGQRASGFDYCLVAIEHTPTRLPRGTETINPLTGLSFHETWLDIGKLLALKDVAKAEPLMAHLRADVVVSPDLTEDDRLIAVAAYDTAYEKRRALLAPATATATRGGRGANTASALRAEAEQRSGAGQASVGEVLSKMATRLQVAAAQPDDLNAAFATEAIALRKSLAGVTRTGLHAASVAEAIAGVAASR
jgi:hypothetical protein